MKHISRAIALAGLVLLVTVSSVYAQYGRETLVSIPFNFTVGEKALPSGKYLIRRNRADSAVVWIIQNKETGESAMVQTNDVRAYETQEKAKFVFRKYDDVYFLSEFWAAGTVTGREIRVTSRERALAKSLAKAPEVHVLIDRAGR
jgi:hypothetical protein